MRIRRMMALAAGVVVLALTPTAMAQEDPAPPDCSDFATQAAAQTALRLDPSDPGGIDGAAGPNSVAGPITVDDAPPHPGDGIACEDNPGTRDEEPVPVSASPTTTTTGPSPTTTTEPSGPSTTQGANEGLPFTGPEHVLPTMVLGLVLLAAGALLLRRNRTQ